MPLSITPRRRFAKLWISLQPLGSQLSLWSEREDLFRIYRRSSRRCAQVLLLRKQQSYLNFLQEFVYQQRS
jgi:hypothetical protein